MELSIVLVIVSLAVAVAAIAYAAVIHFQVREFRRRFQTFFGGEQSKHPNAIIIQNAEKISKANTDLQQLYQATESLHQTSLKSFQKIGVNFYNPFDQTGGILSFSIALLDNRNHGIVLSSLHAREGTRIYAKEIKNGQSKQHLTEEEIEAMRRATDLE